MCIFASMSFLVIVIIGFVLCKHYHLNKFYQPGKSIPSNFSKNNNKCFIPQVISKFTNKFYTK